MYQKFHNPKSLPKDGSCIANNSPHLPAKTHIKSLRKVLQALEHVLYVNHKITCYMRSKLLLQRQLLHHTSNVS